MQSPLRPDVYKCAAVQCDVTARPVCDTGELEHRAIENLLEIVLQISLAIEHNRTGTGNRSVAPIQPALDVRRFEALQAAFFDGYLADNVEHACRPDVGAITNDEDASFIDQAVVEQDQVIFDNERVHNLLARRRRATDGEAGKGRGISQRDGQAARCSNHDVGGGVGDNAALPVGRIVEVACHVTLPTDRQYQVDVLLATRFIASGIGCGPGAYNRRCLSTVRRVHIVRVRDDRSRITIVGRRRCPRLPRVGTKAAGYDDVARTSDHRRNGVHDGDEEIALGRLPMLVLGNIANLSPADREDGARIKRQLQVDGDAAGIVYLGHRQIDDGIAKAHVGAHGQVPRACHKQRCVVVLDSTESLVLNNNHRAWRGRTVQLDEHFFIAFIGRIFEHNDVQRCSRITWSERQQAVGHRLVIAARGADVVRAVLHADLVDTGVLESHDKVQGRRRLRAFGHHGIADFDVDVVVLLDCRRTDESRPLGRRLELRTVDQEVRQGQIEGLVTFMDGVAIDVDLDLELRRARQECRDAALGIVIGERRRRSIARFVIDAHRLLTGPGERDQESKNCHAVIALEAADHARVVESNRIVVGDQAMRQGHDIEVQATGVRVRQFQLEGLVAFVA